MLFKLVLFAFSSEQNFTAKSCEAVLNLFCIKNIHDFATLPLFNSSFVNCVSQRKKPQNLFHSKCLIMTQFPRMRPVAKCCRKLENLVTIIHLTFGTEREMCFVILRVRGNKMVTCVLQSLSSSVRQVGLIWLPTACWGYQLWKN